MFSKIIKDRRVSKGLKLRELSSITKIDQTLLSRFEHGDRLPTEDQLIELMSALKLDFKRTRVEWMASKVLKVVGYDEVSVEALQLAESRVEYLVQKRSKAQTVPKDLKEKLEILDKLKAKWDTRPPLGVSQLKRMQEYFDVDYTYESNRIEGNTLSLQETALVVNEGLTIGGKSMREHLEAINHQEAIAFIRELVISKEDISKRVVLDIHRLVLKEVDSANAGVYRSIPVRITGSDTVLPQPYLIDQLMHDYFEFYMIQSSRMHPVLLAAEMHERLVSIHPFIDGNGRTARLVMNLILLKNGYTRANIKGSTESRMAYYQALQSVQKDANPIPFYHIVAEETIRSIEAHLELI
ncbi:MAG: Fic family protein [Cyclobacteriaceae bacterium]